MKVLAPGRQNGLSEKNRYNANVSTTHVLVACSAGLARAYLKDNHSHHGLQVANKRKALQSSVRVTLAFRKTCSLAF
eukprot:365123-Chlamydomonas_euryale.AAC.44